MAKISAVTNTLTSAAWAGEVFGPDNLVAGGIKVDAAAFFDTDSVLVTLSANAAQNATSISVTALPGPIPSGTLLDFTGAGKYALTTAAAAAGATTISVEALPQALTSGDTARYAGSGTAQKTIYSGTVVGRTFTERASDGKFGPADDADDEVFILAFEITDADKNNDAVAYKPGHIVKENYLPGFASLSAAVLGKIRTLYVTTRGVK